MDFFRQNSINKFYNLPDLDDDDYSRIWKEVVDPDEILRELANPNTTWKCSDADVTNFPASGMILDHKSRHHFISAKHIPSSNLSKVIEQAILNYAIQTSLSIDVAKVIRNNILNTLRGSTQVVSGTRR